MSQDSKTSNNHKLFPFILMIGLVAFVYLIYVISQQFNFKDKIGQLQTTITTQTEQNKIVKQYLFQADQAGQTPFSLLRDNTDAQYTQYDFGVFVTSINGQLANENYYWAVYVNNKYAEEAADKIQLAIGDQVEWRFEEIKH